MKFERMARETMDKCLRELKESNESKFDSYSARNSVLIIFHITFRDYRVALGTFFPTTFLEHVEAAVYLSIMRNALLFRGDSRA